jgi:hypothetical protein
MKRLLFILFFVSAITSATELGVSALGDYRFRGISQSDLQPGLASQVEYTAEIEYLARETAKVLNLDIAGIDLLFDKTGFRVCEANSNPGFKGFEKYCNIDVADVITEYIKFKVQQ